MPARTSPAPQTGEVFVTRQVHFSASHRLFNPALSAEENCTEYGQCANERGHGHNYILDATVAGLPDPRTGYVINLRELKHLLEQEIVEVCDHRYLNDEVPFLAGVIPSTENLLIAFWRRVAPKISHGRLHQMRLYETPRHFADYFGP